MPLDRINNTQFHNDRAQAERSGKAQLGFITQNHSALLKVRNGQELLKKIRNFQNQDFPLTDNQLSEIDRIYEKVMQGLGLPSYSGTYKPGKKQLRY